ncbi:ATP-binding protein [Paucibacter sp. R3-3]|uniref:histidine kinase n=1 Tax=Roseateles agri TaxID=3098619 RepID=A0ABU5DAI7_9BURK|nr:ATP-binding protein [Paucibacter sp. R3-3]MDY0743275.1 ATP-binding protein [Paucibacter sp. R3-3]
MSPGRPANAAAPAARYVVVDGQHVDAEAAAIDPSGPASPAPAGVLSSTAWTTVTETAPLLSAAGVGAITCGLLTSDLSAWSIVWALAGAGLVAGWSLALAFPWRFTPLRSLIWHHRTVSLLAVLLMLWSLGAPESLTDLPPHTAPELLRHSAAVLVACGGAFVFGPLVRLGIPAIALPPLHLLLDRSTAPASWAPSPTILLQALLATMLATALALAARQAWRRRAAAQLAAERRIAEAEAACRAALRADADKTRFLSATSHDLRQPVHALGLFAATLDKRLRGTRDEPLVRNVVRSVEGLDRSLNAMLDVSRLDAGVVEPNFQHFPLRDLFRRLHMQFAGQADLAGLSLRFSPGGKWVTSDPQLLERILANLIQNAMKYTAHGGVVVVVRSSARHFNIEVWDTGVGIAASELPHIFDEYYQVPGHKALRQQGTGMGLAIVRRLVRLLGHRLTVASQPGRGTMFRLSVQQRGSPEVQDLTAPADTLPMPAGRARTVLIVEDDDAVREGLALLLEESGYAALQARSLEDARQTLRMIELPPDLLLTDMRLGSGPDGLEVIEEVRRECGFELPAIIVTGDAVSDDDQPLGNGAHPVLFKPVDPRKLLLRIRSLVA